jgi:hypothetical protein
MNDGKIALEWNFRWLWVSLAPHCTQYSSKDLLIVLQSLHLVIFASSFRFAGRNFLLRTWSQFPAIKEYHICRRMAVNIGLHFAPAGRAYVLQGAIRGRALSAVAPALHKQALPQPHQDD